MSTPELLSDLWNGPDYTGKFDNLIAYYDRDGDFGGNAVRYAIFSTLNDGPGAIGYRQAEEIARREYGLSGWSRDPSWAQGNSLDSGLIVTDYTNSVVQPTVGSWLSLSSWVYWFKVGFLGM